MSPMQILEVRFEADTPVDAMTQLEEALIADGLDIRWTGTED